MQTNFKSLNFSFFRKNDRDRLISWKSQKNFVNFRKVFSWNFWDEFTFWWLSSSFSFFGFILCYQAEFSISFQTLLWRPTFSTWPNILCSAKELAGVHEKGFEIKSSMSKQIRSWNYLKNYGLNFQNWVFQRPNFEKWLFDKLWFEYLWLFWRNKWAFLPEK